MAVTAEVLDRTQGMVAPEGHKNGNGNISDIADPTTISLYSYLDRRNWEKHMRNVEALLDDSSDVLTPDDYERLAAKSGLLERSYQYCLNAGRTISVTRGLIPNDGALTRMVLSTPEEEIAHKQYFGKLAEMSIKKVR